MKIIFLEGEDNIGKTSLSNKLIDSLKDKKNFEIIYIHSKKPEEILNKSIYEVECEIYENMINELKDIYKKELIKNIDYNLSSEYYSYTRKKNFLEKIYILDRSWFDMYIYDCLYRSENKDKVFSKIKLLMDNFSDNISKSNMIYIWLYASPEFIINHDDQKSFFSEIKDSDKKIEKIKLENIYFKKMKQLASNYMQTKSLNVEDSNKNFNDKKINNIINYLTTNFIK